MSDVRTQLLAIVPHSGERDDHLSTCTLAKAGGPDATLACATCGRAQWMHATRHDTCGYFHWVDESSLTNTAIMALRHHPACPVPQRLECARALNEFGTVHASSVREARRNIAAFINNVYRGRA